MRGGAGGSADVGAVIADATPAGPMRELAGRLRCADCCSPASLLAVPMRCELLVDAEERGRWGLSGREIANTACVGAGIGSEGGACVGIAGGRSSGCRSEGRLVRM